MKKINSKNFFLSFLLLLTVGNVLAQSAITGRLVNINEKGVESAAIRVLRQDSTFVIGTNSDSLGMFQIEKIPTGEYFLCISHIDFIKMYKSISIQQGDVNLGDIYLKENQRKLTNVEVVANRFIKKKDGMIVYPTKEQKKFSSTGYDLISNMMIPGITVDKENGSITQNSRNVSIYIDGQKAEMQELTALNIDKVDKIDYIDMPSGRFVQDDVVINVIMKKKEGGIYAAIDDQQNLCFMRNKFNFTVQRTNKKISSNYMVETIFATIRILAAISTKNIISAIQSLNAIVTQ